MGDREPRNYSQPQSNYGGNTYNYGGSNYGYRDDRYSDRYNDRYNNYNNYDYRRDDYRRDDYRRNDAMILDSLNRIRNMAGAVCDGYCNRYGYSRNVADRAYDRLRSDANNGNLGRRIESNFKNGYPTDKELEDMIVSYVLESIRMDREAGGDGYGRRREYSYDDRGTTERRPRYRAEYGDPSYNRYGYRADNRNDDYRDGNYGREYTLSGSYHAGDDTGGNFGAGQYDRYVNPTQDLERREYTSEPEPQRASKPRPATAQRQEPAPVQQVKRPDPEPFEDIEEQVILNSDLEKIQEQRKKDPFAEWDIIKVAKYTCTLTGKKQDNSDPYKKQIDPTEDVDVVYNKISEPVESIHEVIGKLADVKTLNDNKKVNIIRFTEVQPIDLSYNPHIEIFKRICRLVNGAVPDSGFSSVDDVLTVARKIINEIITGNATFAQVIGKVIVDKFNVASRTALAKFRNDSLKVTGIQVSELKDILDVISLDEAGVLKMGLTNSYELYKYMVNLCLEASLFTVFTPHGINYVDPFSSVSDMNRILSRGDVYVYHEGTRLRAISKEMFEKDKALIDKIASIINKRIYLLIDRKIMQTNLDIAEVLYVKDDQKSKLLAGNVRYAAMINDITTKLGYIDVVDPESGNDTVQRISVSLLPNCVIVKKAA